MRLWLFFAGMIFLGSCISNKKVTLLQKDDLNAEDLHKDSLLRTYHIGDVNYSVQPEDLLSIRIESLTPQEFDVFNRPGSSSSNAGLSGGQPNMLIIGELVDHDGNIPFLLTGKVKVSGLSVFQIQDTLQSIANQFLKLPVVKVRLVNYRFTILGEVNNEGTVQVGNNRVSFIEAMGLSGGLTELADRSNIKLIRQMNGKADVYYVNLLDENFFNSPLYYIQPNDVIIVPPLRQRPLRKYFSQNVAVVLSAVSAILLIINLSQ